jgi:thioredoxin-related protein
MNIIRMLLICLLLPVSAYAGPVSLLDDLQQDAKQAKQLGKPLVVLYTASYCHFCEAVKTEFFNHMAKDEAYRSRIILREVIIDSSESLKGIDGNRRNHGAFASAKGVSLVPTVGFYDAAGDDIAKPLVGIATLDFYGWYLNQRITNAEQAMKQPDATLPSDS